MLMLGLSLFPHDAQFQGRQVVTFHNQRDYIFVRHHRYVFDEKKLKKPKEGEPQPPLEIKDRVKARLQELGPRFTLKLRWLQEGKWNNMGILFLMDSRSPRIGLCMLNDFCRTIIPGMFDTHFGEYEWIHKRKQMDTTRRKFHL
jgi:ribosome production factor 1